MQHNILREKKILWIYVLVLIAMVCGTFFDYEISCAIFNENSLFARFFASFGQYPVGIASIIIGFILFYVTERKLKLTTVLAYIGGIVCYIMAVMMMAIDPYQYLGIPMIAALLISLAVTLGVSYLMSRYVKDMDRTTLKKLALFMFIVAYGQLIIINLIKPLAARPRMRMIAVTPEAYFQPWYVFGSEMKQALTSSLGIASEEFKSFPSGHTGCASVIMAFSVMPYLKGRNTSGRWFIAGFIFTVIVMISRIIAGAHFLSDVTIGMAVTLSVIIIADRIIFGGKNE